MPIRARGKYGVLFPHKIGNIGSSGWVFSIDFGFDIPLHQVLRISTFNKIEH
jgi:hypothetical protein